MSLSFSGKIYFISHKHSWIRALCSFASYGFLGSQKQLSYGQTLQAQQYLTKLKYTLNYVFFFACLCLALAMSALNCEFRLCLVGFGVGSILWKYRCDAVGHADASLS